MYWYLFYYGTLYNEISTDTSFLTDSFCLILTMIHPTSFVLVFLILVIHSHTYLGENMMPHVNPSHPTQSIHGLYTSFTTSLRRLHIAYLSLRSNYTAIAILIFSLCSLFFIALLNNLFYDFLYIAILGEFLISDSRGVRFRCIP